MDRRHSRRRSLLDEMQLVEEEQKSEELSRSLRNVVDAGGGVDFFPDHHHHDERGVGVVVMDSVTTDDEEEDDGSSSHHHHHDDDEINHHHPTLFHQIIDMDASDHLETTIYEGEVETSEDDDYFDEEVDDVVLAAAAAATKMGSKPAPRASLTGLDPLYEEGEAEEEESSISLSHDASFYYDENNNNNNNNQGLSSLVSANFSMDPGSESPPPGFQYAARRNNSLAASRRSIRSSGDSSSEHMSITSLPNPTTISSESTISGATDDTVHRRRSGTELSGSRSLSKRRSNFYRQSIVVPDGGGNSSTDGDLFTNTVSSLDSSGNSSTTSHRRLGRLMSRTSKGLVTASTRPSTRRSSNRSVIIGGDNSPAGAAGGSNNNIDIASAVDRLESSIDIEGNNWDHTVAAAAIVAATTNAPGAQRHIKQYSPGDHVLVLVGMLNVQNLGMDDPMDFTISPVNELGYPKGKGRTEQQKQEPFSYLICTVTKVYFDEDERYYTVCRGDTGSEQRAEPSLMRPITDEAAVEIAFTAARRTRRHDPELNMRDRGKHGPLEKYLRILKVWPVRFYRKKLVPWYREARGRVKVVSSHLLHGDTGYAFKVRLTGINFLVVCSFLYLVNDVFTLSFLTCDWDYVSAVIGLIVWIVLLLELLFEGLIRPENYKQLKASDKAYAPATARNISAFHLWFESAALFLYIPQFPCVYDRDRCGDDTFFGNIYASVLANSDREHYKAAFGRVILGLTFLRLFGLVRHWKQMWLSNVFENDNSNSKIVRRMLLMGADGASQTSILFRRSNRKKNEDNDDDSIEDVGDIKDSKSNVEDQDLKNAANIGTALMTVNSNRVLVLILVVVLIFPAINTIKDGNYANEQLLELLQANNIAANSTDDCDYLLEAARNWLKGSARVHAETESFLSVETDTHVVWAQLLPIRCEWQRDDGVITDCRKLNLGGGACDLWNDGPALPDEASPEYFADVLGLRVGELQQYERSNRLDFQSVGNTTIYYVKSINDFSHSITSTFRSLFFLQVSLLVVALFGLTVMRFDAGRLVLDPLQRMLKIVVRYAENPLSRTLSGKKKSSSFGNGRSTRGNSAEQLGSYETDQLINAIAKIADLLRKCWGVAGAGIISSNLARTKDGKTAVFNPTVPGKRVYALFGFVAIREFDMMLRALKGDVMVLINDVAQVVHDEVFRWSLGDSGQCNKNLGAAFLMVFRIGDFSEVHDKKKIATAVVFESNVKTRPARIKKRRGSKTGQYLRSSASRRPTMSKFELGANGTLQLASLPGIQLFTDRALLGLLKSYAGILRDEKIVGWNRDFRLGAGVGLFSVSIIYGMDAGWAVEGAVGSNYKIDATYLSPHVNMASRMMSATKQYGVTILLSQAVEELLSRPAQSKLRHLDTVIVKGASRPQCIYTYDARAEGTNFFLFDRTGEQADLEAESYTSALWDTDQDLKAMRQHVNEQFMQKFKKGVDLYISGEWKSAIEILKEADNIMLQTVMEEAWVDATEFSDSVLDSQTDDEEITRLRNRYGDGACKNLINYMERRKAKPPPDWRGYRALMSK